MPFKDGYVLSTVLFIAISVASICLTSISCSPGGESAKADTVFFNGVIYTVDDAFSVAEAAAIKDGKFIAVGGDEEILALAGPQTRRIDLGGKAVVPGLVDAHAHMMLYSLGLDRIDAMGAPGAAAVAEMVAAWATMIPAGDWITGWGWDSNDWEGMEFPTRGMLDEAAPENPVSLFKQDGHAAWVNSEALRIAGIDRNTPDPPGGTIIRDSRGNPTGVLIDTAMNLVNSHIPEAPFEKQKELLTKAVQKWLAVGLVGIHDMGDGPEEAALVKALIDDGAFPFRIYFSYDNTLDNLDELLAAGTEEYGDGRLVIRSIKAFIDGSLGSHSAALLEPFEGRPGDTGLQITSRDELTDLAERCLNAGFQLETHACGDRGARIILDAYEEALSRVPTPDHRFRIEHAQMVDADDIPRFAQLGVIPSMQPTHCTSDNPWVIELVGAERAAGLYAWRSMLDAGSYIPCGSDFPVESINPMLGIYAAITRQHEDGTPEGGYNPEQRMTREEVLRGFTIWAAKAAFQEDRLGSIEPGKRADLVVLDRDIMKVPPLEIPGTKVLMTIFEGDVVYNSEPGVTEEQ
ncbi:MAG TPA: amidohydrolase [Acidobacteriota bacterium]|nr:amidohydrolase [Acidobacteriota bacterium]